ncbi:hypothetical protein [Thiomicrorhabdus sediminis]|nr:hypothetical protein [Thiomicrorhabdus sediminis]
MKNSKLDKKISKTWKKLLKANVHHDESQANSLMKEMIMLEIEQKRRRH